MVFEGFFFCLCSVNRFLFIVRVFMFGNDQNHRTVINRKYKSLINACFCFSVLQFGNPLYMQRYIAKNSEKKVHHGKLGDRANKKNWHGTRRRRAAIVHKWFFRRPRRARLVSAPRGCKKSRRSKEQRMTDTCAASLLCCNLLWCKCFRSFQPKERDCLYRRLHPMCFSAGL